MVVEHQTISYGGRIFSMVWRGIEEEGVMVVV
jgi:hypothetical protein